MNELDLNKKSGRVAKNGVSIWLSIVCIIVIFLISCIPNLGDIYLSFQQYNYIEDSLGSNYIGFDNYSMLINSEKFYKVLVSTIRNGLIFGIFLILFSTLVGGIVGRLPRGGMLKKSIVTLFLIVVFIPEVVYVSWFLRFEGLSNPDIMIWFLPFIRAVKYMGIPILVSSVIGEMRKSNSMLLPIQAGTCFALFSFMFALGNDFIFTWIVYTPQNKDVVDSLERIAFEFGLFYMDVSLSATVLVVRQLLSILFIVILFIPFWVISKSLFYIPNLEGAKEKINYKNNIISSLIAIILLGIIVGVILLIRGINPFEGMEPLISEDLKVIPLLILYIVFSALAAIVQLILSVIIAYPIACGKSAAKIIGLIFLIMLSVLSSSSFSMGQYMMFVNLGVIDTPVAVLGSLIFPVSCVWGVLAVARIKKAKDGRTYLKAIGLPAVGIMLAQIVFNMNNIVPSLIYMMDPNLSSPLIRYRQILISFADMTEQFSLFNSTVFWYSIILSFVPISILIILRSFFSNASLLAIIGLGQRK